MRNRLARALSIAALGALGTSWYGLAPVAAQSGAVCGTDMRVLVGSKDGTEADLPAIRQALDYVGTPYVVRVATEHADPLAADDLATGCRALYQGVILTTGSAFTPGELDVLASYESGFGVRQVTWYTFPEPALGFNYPETAHGTPVTATLTPAGAGVFRYLNASTSASPISIQYSWTYLATPLDANTTPLLIDDSGHTLAAVRTYADGRQNLAMTFDSNPYLLHSVLLSYGVINWVTRGVFIGERHVYMSPQVDDVFIPDQQWLASTPCGTSVTQTGVTKRMTGADFNAVHAWQRLQRRKGIARDLRLTMAFNGAGTTGLYDPDTLTRVARHRQEAFFWVNHTYSHPNLDAISESDAFTEITLNNAVASQLGLEWFNPINLVQPEVSGLNNAAFLKAASAAGVGYLVSDTSKPGGDNPVPNTGRWSAAQPDIFVIPRRPNNLFFNVAEPADWAAEYNCLYNGFWGRDLSYDEILDVESQNLLGYLLRGDLDPWMFHQTNLVAYDGDHALLTDLLDRTLTKYRGYFTLPVVSPTMDFVGARMANRTAARAAGVSATIEPGTGIWLSSPVDVTVPITGLEVEGAESYGGQSISWITLEANQPVLKPFTRAPEEVLPPTASAGQPQTVTSGTVVTLIGAGIDPNIPARPLTFAWKQTAGPSVSLTNANAAVATFTAPMFHVGAKPPELRFKLTVGNGVSRATSETTVTVHMPLPPTADAGTSQTVTPGTVVTLTGRGTDPNAPPLPLTFGWSQTSGPPVVLTNANAAVATFIAPSPSGSKPVVRGFTLTVSNGASSATSHTTVAVLVPDPPKSKKKS